LSHRFVTLRYRTTISWTSYKMNETYHLFNIIKVLVNFGLKSLSIGLYSDWEMRSLSAIAMKAMKSNECNKAHDIWYWLKIFTHFYCTSICPMAQIIDIAQYESMWGTKKDINNTFMSWILNRFKFLYVFMTSPTIKALISRVSRTILLFF